MEKRLNMLWSIKKVSTRRKKQMTHETVTAMWNSVRSRFTRKVNTLTHEDLNRQLGETTVADLLYHTGEAEYIFMEWYFNKEMPFHENIFCFTCMIKQVGNGCF